MPVPFEALENTARSLNECAPGSRTGRQPRSTMPQILSTTRMRLLVHEAALPLGLQNAAAVLLRDVRVTTDPGSLADEVSALVNRIQRESERILSTPEARGARELFAALGYPRQRPAGHRLVELIRKRGFRRHNNLIDACNLVSATFGAGLGLHDTSALRGDIHVDRSDGTVEIRPLFKDSCERIPAGDLVYTSGGHAVAWLGRKDIDGQEFAVTSATTGVLLVVLGNRATSSDYNRSLCSMFVQSVQMTCPDMRSSMLALEVIA